MEKSFHLTYRPAELPLRAKDQIISLIETDDPMDVLLQSETLPDTVTLMLMAHDMEEATREIAELGFGY